MGGVGLYVSLIRLIVDQEEITDFISLTENEYEVYRAAKLLNSTKFYKVQPRFTIDVEYVIPKNYQEFDFEKVIDSTLVIDRLDGYQSIKYSGVYTLKIGKTKYMDREAASYIVTLGARHKYS